MNIQNSFFSLLCSLWLSCLSISCNSSLTLSLFQWSTSRRCRPSLKARGPLGLLSHGTLPLQLPRGGLNSPPLKWKSLAASHWRCARCHANSAPQTQKTGTAYQRKNDLSLKITMILRESYTWTSPWRISIIYYESSSPPLPHVMFFSNRPPFPSAFISRLVSFSPHLLCQVFWGDFAQQKELCVPASKRPSHGPVLVQCHPGLYCQPATASKRGDEEYAAWHGCETSGLDYRAGMQKYKRKSSTLPHLLYVFDVW